MRALAITDAFGAYQVGQTVTDTAEMEAIAASHPSYVVAVEVDDPPGKPAKADKAESGADLPADAASPSVGS